MTRTASHPPRGTRAAVPPRYLVLTILVLVALVGAYLWLDARRLQQELQRELRERSTSLLWSVMQRRGYRGPGGSAPSPVPADMQAVLEELGERPDVADVALLSGTGVVLAHSDPRQIGRHYGRAAPEAGMTEGRLRRGGPDTGEVYEVSVPFPLAQQADGELRLALSMAPIRAVWAQHRRATLVAMLSIAVAGVLGVLAIFLNQQRFLRSVQAVQEKAEREQRLAALGNLAAGVAHEIRNPLNALAMGLQRLTQEWRLAPEEDREEFIRLGGLLQTEIARLNEIVERFLRLARPAPLHLDTCLIERHLSELLALIQPQASAKGIAIEAAVALDGAVARLDGAQIRQALLNVLMNALQAMPHGGTLRVTTRITAEQLEIGIADTGPGISPEDVPRIFEPYFTTKEAGTGLGLALAKRIVEAHDGNIDVETGPTQGTTFRIRLPLAGPGERRNG